VELRKLGSERHTLRARLRREADRLRELESALRAEKALHAQAADEHFAALLGLRSRLVEVETESAAELARLRDELEQARGELSGARTELEQTRSELSGARTELEQAQLRAGGAQAPAVSGRAGRAPQGLRRIRGIGPAYQRVLEQAGVHRVQQVAGWSAADVQAYAEKLKIKPERITKDDWIGQAKALEPDPDE
jgi:predicted flap endonuclease-1-like 5' DNA nuclease